MMRGSTAYLKIVLLAAAVILAATGEMHGAEKTIQPGDKVKVINGPAPLKRGTKVLTEVPTGTELEVKKVKGKWIGVPFVKDGKRIFGWIHEKRLTLAPKTEQEPPPPPPKPGDLPAMKPSGFFVSRALSQGKHPVRGTQWVYPTKEEASFLVVVVSVPGGYFMPSKNGDAFWSTTYDPTRFTITLADERCSKAGFICRWWEEEKKFFGDFSILYTSQQEFAQAMEAAQRARNEMQVLALVWVVHTKDCKLPLKIQIDKERPVAVPDNKVPAP